MATVGSVIVPPHPFLPWRTTVDPAFEAIDVLVRPRHVARHRARANSRENRVCVCFDGVERPEVEEVKHRRPVPLSKERFDVAVERWRAVVGIRHGVLLFNFRPHVLLGQRLLKTAWPGPFCCRLTSPSWTSWLRITTGPSAWVTASAAATPPERQAWSIRLAAA